MVLENWVAPHLYPFLVWSMWPSPMLNELPRTHLLLAGAPIHGPTLRTEYLQHTQRSMACTCAALRSQVQARGTRTC